MEESEEILIKSLKNLGIEIPPHITSIKELDSSSFFSISSQSLHLLLHNTNTSSFPTSLPDSMPEKVNSCSHLASLLHHLSYPFQISFHQVINTLFFLLFFFLCICNTISWNWEINLQSFSVNFGVVPFSFLGIIDFGDHLLDIYALFNCLLLVVCCGMFTWVFVVFLPKSVHMSVRWEPYARWTW